MLLLLVRQAVAFRQHLIVSIAWGAAFWNYTNIFHCSHLTAQKGKKSIVYLKQKRGLGHFKEAK